MTSHRDYLKIAGLLALAIAMPSQAYAQVDSYPNRPVRIISDSAPGSAVDVGLRIIADGLGQHWGQQVLVVNHPGAGGAVSARVAAEAVPDGYTLYAPALSVFLTLPGKAPNLPVELPRDFAPIGFTADQPMSIGVSPALGINTLPELIALAKKRPGEISYAVSGVGRLTHLTGELLQIRTGIKLQMVPYTGGSAQALSDVIGGRISMVIEGYAGLAGAFASGRSRRLRSARRNGCRANRTITVLTLCAMLLALCSSATAQQPKKVPHIGYVSNSDPVTESARAEATRLALGELGYTEGQNIATEYRYAEGKPDRYSELVAELVRLKVDIIVVSGGDTPGSGRPRMRRRRFPSLWRAAGSILSRQASSKALPVPAATSLVLQTLTQN